MERSKGESIWGKQPKSEHNRQQKYKAVMQKKKKKTERMWKDVGSAEQFFPDL